VDPKQDQYNQHAEHYQYNITTHVARS